MSNNHYKRFSDLSFADFKNLAKDTSLSKYEKIGFPDSYRQNKEEAIFKDIQSKLSLLSEKDKVVLDIGCGCSDLPLMLIKQCELNFHQLLLVDSHEMLELIPNKSFIKKYPGMYPAAIQNFNDLKNKVDIILIYSVFHYIFSEGNIYSFIDKSLSLLKPGGQMLIGDIPNSSKRKRFFNSETGKIFHQAFMKTQELPKIEFLKIEEGQIDDAVITGLFNRIRSQGFDAYIMPQGVELPMANRREDMLVIRP